MKLRIVIVVSILSITNVFLLGSTSTAQAGTLCKNYDRYSGSGYSNQRGMLCAAPSSDYRNYQGWLGVVTDGGAVSTTPHPCAFSLFPYDFDDPMPMIACPAVAPGPAPSWTWHPTKGWVSDSDPFGGGYVNAIYQGAEVYVYPFTNEWRWVYAKRADGTYSWHAIEAKYVALRWFTPRSMMLR